jgi:hypothetical protein
MSLNKSSAQNEMFSPTQWIGRDGMPLACEEKILLLNDHMQEIQALCQQAFEEAMHMGCSEEFLRIVLQNMISSLTRTNRKPFNC